MYKVVRENEVTYTNSIVLYVKTILSINHVSKLVRNRLHIKRTKRDVMLYIRIFCILGFTWLFGLLTVFIPNGGGESVEKILVYFHVIFNGLQGVFIFSVFTTNKRVYNLYKKALSECKHKTKRCLRKLKREKTVQPEDRATQIRPPKIEVHHHHYCGCTTNLTPQNGSDFNGLPTDVPACNCKMKSLDVKEAWIAYSEDNRQTSGDQDTPVKRRNKPASLPKGRKGSVESMSSIHSSLTICTSLSSQTTRASAEGAVNQGFEINLSDVEEDREPSASSGYYE